MNDSPWKPPFMRWWETDFFGSHNVRKMPALARLMYRALLQSAWHSDRPPYAPNNDADLMAMADAPSPEDWQKHKSCVLQRFQTTDDGQWLYHAKALDEYARALSEHQRKGDAVRRRWEEQTKPATTTKEKTRKTLLPANFGISDAVRTWAAEHGFTQLEQHFEHFVGVAKAKAYQYANWDQALQNAIRQNWARLETKPRDNGTSLLERTKAAMEVVD